MVAGVVRRIAIIRMLALAAALAPAPVAALGSNPRLDLSDASYTSPTWGYAIRWHSAEWTADQPTSSSGDDLLQLRKPDGEFIRYEGTSRFGDGPADCHTALIDGLSGLSAVRDLAILLDVAGRPSEFENAVRADGLYDFQFQQNGASTVWKAWLDCQSLVPGQAVLAITYLAPDRSFDAQHEQAQRVIPSRRSVFPFSDAAQAPGWTSAEACNPPQVGRSTTAAPLATPASPTPGLKDVTLQLMYPPGAPFPVTVDASTIFLLDANDVVYWPVAFRWSGAPSGPTAARQTLPVTSSADLDLRFEIPATARPASVYSAALGRAVPTLAGEIGCLGSSNGLALRPMEGYVEPQIRFIFAPDGAERGMVTWLDSASDPSGDVVLLNFTNTGSAPWAIDPRALVAENKFSVTPANPQTKPLAALLDADPAAPGRSHPVAGPITLTPGQHVVVRLSFPTGTLQCDRLLFVPTPNQYVALNDPQCVGEAGAAPIIRMSE